MTQASRDVLWRRNDKTGAWHHRREPREACPVVSVEENLVKVSVGSVFHPMEEDHSIQWVYLQTDKGGHRKCLEIGKEPTVSFALVDEKPIAAYAYCNKHGLWKTDI